MNAILSSDSSSSDPTTYAHRMITRAMDAIRKPNPKYAFRTILSHDIVEPTCFSQAKQFLEWRAAVVDEFNALQRIGTWTLVLYHPSMTVLSSK